MQIYHSYFIMNLTDMDFLQIIAFVICNDFLFRNLAIGIGIQNFPEGMAVSLPLRGAGHPVWWAFWYVL